MRQTPSPVLLPVALLLACWITPAASAQVAATKSRVVVNLGTSNITSAGGTWGGNMSKTKAGVFIHGEATGSGSVGDKDLNVDLSCETFLDFVLAVGPENATTQVRLVLRDLDGTEVAWNVTLAGMQPQVPKEVHLEIDKPDAILAPGTEPGFNRKSVDYWRIEGDGSENAAQLLLMQVRAGH